MLAIAIECCRLARSCVEEDPLKLVCITYDVVRQLLRRIRGCLWHVEETGGLEAPRVAMGNVDTTLKRVD